jgi:hypothetical protein
MADITGTGDIIGSQVIIAGSGYRTIYDNGGSVSLLNSLVIISGAGDVTSNNITGTGALVKSQIIVSGLGNLGHNGTGALVKSQIIVSGSGNSSSPGTHSGSGAIVLSGAPSIFAITSQISQPGDFPPGSLALQEDSKYYSEKQADPVMRSEAEGGYIITRARYTRKPRKTFTTGFTGITNAEKALIQDFWDTKMGGTEQFTWKNRANDILYTVRFNGQPSFTYVGAGKLSRWDVSNITLEQV